MEAVRIIKSYSAFSIAQEILKRKDWVKYKTIPEWHGRIIDGHILTGDPGKEFNEITNEYVNAYIFQEKVPPAEIATAIMNIADDYLNNREIVIKAGDYIAIQNFIHAKPKKIKGNIG